MIINDMAYEWLTWGVSRVPGGDLPAGVLARIDTDRQRATALPLVLRTIPIHWTIDRSVNKRFTGHAYRLRSAWRRFAELRFNERRIYIEAFGGFGSGPGFGFNDVRICLDGAIAGRAWLGGCSLGFGGRAGPAVAMLSDDHALRVAPQLQVDQRWEAWQLLVLTRPETRSGVESRRGRSGLESSLNPIKSSRAMHPPHLLNPPLANRSIVAMFVHPRHPRHPRHSQSRQQYQPACQIRQQ